VVDGSDVNPLAQVSAVRQVISEVTADHHGDPAPELLVVNKVDAASGLGLAKLRRALPGALFVSARTGDGIDALPPPDGGAGRSYRHRGRRRNPL